MRTISFNREKKFVGCAVMFQVQCDGKLVCTLRNGESKSVSIDEEKHSIQCFADLVDFETNITRRVYSDFIDIPSGTKNLNLNLKLGTNSIKISGLDSSGNQNSGKKKRKFSLGIFLLLTLFTGIGGIIYAIVINMKKN